MNFLLNDYTNFKLNVWLNQEQKKKAKKYCLW